MPNNPDRNMKNENFSSQLGTYFKRHMGFKEQEDFQTVLRADGETETTQDFLIGIVGGGMDSNWVHSALQPPTVPAPGDYNDGENGGMTGRGNRSTRPQCRFVHHRPHMLCPEANLGRRGGEASD
jgi:hypothetical protein